jgi:mannose-6-phosphate isomerase-like protein (cupin superfamily)
MSHPDLVYPPPAYGGHDGLENSTLHRADAPPDLTYRSGGTVHYLATRTSTNGQFGLYRWTMAAEPSGPEPHFHRSISESFYVLSGTIRMYDGREWVDGQPGDFLFVPEGGVHAFRNESGSPASMLILFAPGADREDYFETLDRVGRGLVMDDEQRAAFFVRHDTFWLPQDGD